MLRHVAPYGDFVHAYPEISYGITRAANQDPLFPFRRDGCERTAAFLVAIAWHRSKFHPNALRGPREARRYGLYQIHPPAGKNAGHLLLRPMTASFIAIDLVRTSVMNMRESWQWHETAEKICRRESIRAPKARLMAPNKSDADYGETWR